MTTFSINRKLLQTELALLTTVRARKETIPILSSVMMEWDASLTLTASSLDITLISMVELPQTLTVEHDSFCLPLRELHRLVSLFESDDVVFTVDRDGKGAGRVLVQGGKSKHKLPYWEAKEFPDVDQAKGESFSINGDELRQGLQLVLPFVTREGSRWALAGVNFEQKGESLNLVATDGYRLGITSIETPCGDTTTLIPESAAKLLSHLRGEVIAITINDNCASFQSDQRTLTTRLLTGTFPNWEIIMPKDLPSRVEIATAPLVAVLKRVSVTRDDYFKTGYGTMRGGVKFTLAADSLTVETKENNKGHSVESIAVTGNLNGDNVAIGLDPDYVMDMLNNAPEQVVCEFKDGDSQLLFTWPESKFRYVLMPRKL